MEHQATGVGYLTIPGPQKLLFWGGEHEQQSLARGFARSDRIDRDVAPFVSVRTDAAGADRLVRQLPQSYSVGSADKRLHGGYPVG